MRNYGVLLTLGTTAALTAAGALRRRGSRAAKAVPVIYGPDRTKAQQMVLPDGRIVPYRHSIRGKRSLTDEGGFAFSGAELSYVFKDYNSVDHDRLDDLAEALNAATWRTQRQALSLANEILGGFGIEGFKFDENDFSRNAPSLDYVNMGDTYATTIILDNEHGFYISSWGDVVESLPREDEEDEAW